MTTSSNNKQIPSVKLVLLGESSVGKSSIVTKYANDTFLEGREATIGAAFTAKICSTGTDRGDIKFEIWDTAGQERFHSLAPMYYRNSLAAMVVFDVTKYSSFEKAKVWVQELSKQASLNILICLVGNKIDLIEQQAGCLRDVPKEEAESYALESKILYAETSAKSGVNISHVFQQIAVNLPLELINKPCNLINERNDLDLNEQEKKSCAC